MSTSLQEMADNHDRAKRALLAVLVAFPDARPECLWDDGPPVPLAESDEAVALATGIEVRLVSGKPHFFLSVAVPFSSDAEDGEGREDTVQVYVARACWRASAPWYSVLDKLSEQGKREMIAAVKGAT